ncbi:MAG TPA: carboxypeptidase regulatory-like domain-containing protein [Polyangiaceae bacterium]|nr:carboxypeptidase regulatory-like domain-containing protein [Polyangiaceae bacterium]
MPGPDAGAPLMQVVCPGNGTTSLEGTVYDPAGVLPLYNVVVYVPDAPVGPIFAGASCSDCENWYTAPLVSALTDAAGAFTIKNMPIGPNIPLIVQVGKWRMQYTLSNVAACVSNDAATLAGTKLRLPRNHTEGNIPNIAVSTGAADTLECLFARMGVDAAEYTGDPAGAGRIHIFTGGDTANGRGGAVTNPPVSKPSYQYLWNDDSSMYPYDLVLLSCEGSETAFLNDAGRMVLWDFANAGGRVLASHFHYSWFTPTGPFSTVTPPLATWSTGNGVVGDGVSAYNADIVTTRTNGTEFAEGMELKAWLDDVGALTDGGLPLYYTRDNATVAVANGSQPWITLGPSTPAPRATQYFSFDFPYGVAPSEQCGRIAYSDLHVSGGAGAQAAPGVPPDYPNVASSGVVPDGCASHALTPEEKALEFMIFDLSACWTPTSIPPPPPAPF